MTKVVRIAPGQYSDGINRVLAKTKSEAEKLLAAKKESSVVVADRKQKNSSPQTVSVTPVNEIPPFSASVESGVNSSVIWLDLLGAAAYQSIAVEACISLLKRNIKVGVGFFWLEFGSGKDLLVALYNAGVRHFRIQALWGGSGHIYAARESKTALIIAQEIEIFKRNYRDADIYFSPFCEHNNSASFMLPLFGQLARVAPSLKYVNTVWKGALLNNSAVIDEVHWFDKPLPPGRFFVSADGVLGKSDSAGLIDIDAVGWNNRYSSALAKFGWIKRFNLTEAKQPAKIPPKTRRAKPTVKDILAVAWIMLPFSEKPFVDGAVEFPVGVSNCVWKPMSEDVYNANAGASEDTRERRPVFIYPKKDSDNIITITDIRGNKICDSGRGSEYSGGGLRWYFPVYGWEMAEKAKINSGSEWVLVQIGSEKLLIHPAFRWGHFR